LQLVVDWKTRTNNNSTNFFQCSEVSVGLVQLCSHWHYGTTLMRQDESFSADLTLRSRKYAIICLVEICSPNQDLQNSPFGVLECLASCHHVLQGFWGAKDQHSQLFHCEPPTVPR
jgi:hypothetical protein